MTVTTGTPEGLADGGILLALVVVLLVVRWYSRTVVVLVISKWFGEKINWYELPEIGSGASTVAEWSRHKGYQHVQGDESGGAEASS
jgi:hypothetical protein